MNRREYVGPSVDAVMGWWLGSFGNPEAQDSGVYEGLIEWWTTDAPEAALEVVHVVCQAINDAGYIITKQAGEVT